MDSTEIIDTNKKYTIKNFVLPTALIAALVRTLIDTLPKILGTGPILYYSTFLICFIAEIILIVMLTKKYKAKNNGLLSLKEALQIGITTMVIIATIYSVVSYLYIEFIDPNFATDMALKWGALFGQEENVRKQLEASNTASGSNAIGIITSILWFTFIGFVISMITGSVLKKTEDSF